MQYNNKSNETMRYNKNNKTGQRTKSAHELKEWFKKISF